MLLFDLLDAIIKFIIGLIPAVIALVSLFIAYYFYIKNDKKYNFKDNFKYNLKSPFKDNFKHISKDFKNYFYNRGCYEHKNKKCKFDLTKHLSFKCPKEFCSNKKEHFVNQNFLIPSNSKLSKIITNSETKEDSNYI